MIPNLLKLRWREGAIGGLLLAALFLLVQWKKTDDELQKARLAYENPATSNSIQEMHAEGPSVTIVRTWKSRKPKNETPFGGTISVNPTVTKEAAWKDGGYDEKIEKIEWKEGMSATKTSEWTRTPVSIPSSIGGRTDRWLVTLGANRLSADTEGKLLFVGYGWRNRFDLQAGAIRKDEKTTPWVTGTLRF